MDATEDPAVFRDANLSAYRAVVFLLTTGEVLDGEGQSALERFVRSGGGWAGVPGSSLRADSKNKVAGAGSKDASAGPQGLSPRLA